jgi:hypothetical protein
MTLLQSIKLTTSLKPKYFQTVKFYGWLVLENSLNVIIKFTLQ